MLTVDQCFRRGFVNADRQADRSYRRVDSSSEAGRLELFDEDLPGFCIRVTSKNRRSACVFYRVGPRLRRATLGTLPPLTLAILKDLRPVTGKAPWVFVGQRGASLANNPARWTEFVRKAAGLAFAL